MKILQANVNEEKGWYLGRWNSDLPISIGYANRGVDEPHRNARITEIYLVGMGGSRVRVDHETLALAAGDMLVVEPGEAHTFLESTPDYIHFVIHVPGLASEAAAGEMVAVYREELGL